MSAVPHTRRWEPVAPHPEASNPGDGDGEVVLQDPAHVLPPPPPCHGEMPVFSVLTTLFEALSNERKQDRRRGMLERWFANWRVNVGNDFYPILRLLLPQKDRERSVYYLKEATIAKAFIAVMGIDKTPDAMALLHWKKPMPGQRGTVGDFTTTLWEVVAKRSTVMEGTLRIDQLNDLLDELSRSGSKLDNVKRILAQLYSRAAPSEIRWIARIILKDLIISVKETTILSVFHPDALAVFNSCSDLKRVAYELWDPNHRLEESEKTIHLFRSFAPMLSKRPLKTLAEAVRKVGERNFIIEEKLDGERIQLHKRGAEYLYCSRKGKNYTYLYGRHVGEGSLTPFIDGAFDPRVHDCILDGEMLVWDPVSETYLPFGHLKTHASDTAPKKRLNPRPCFVVFDLLYLNGKSLIDRSLIERKKNLRSIFKHIPGRLENVNEFPGNGVKDVQDRLRQVVEARGEGLIIKHPRSPYILNGRVDHWIKIKPEYMDGMAETVDLLVVAANYGTGRRAGGVSTLICALLDEGGGRDGEVTKYSTFCRIGTGLSYADFVGIRERKWVEWEKGKPLDFLQTAARSPDDKGDVYIRPENSFIITVKAADFIISDQYHMPLTLRFPRAVRIRDELTAEDCATVNEIWRMHTTRKKRKAEEEQTTIHTKKRKTTTKKVEVASSHQVAKVDDITATSNIFKDDIFVMIKSIQPVVKYDVGELQRIVIKHGGDFRTVSRGGDNEIVIFGGRNKPPNIKNYITQGRKIVYPRWILDCDKAGTRLPLRKKYFFHNPTEESDTEQESADEGNGSEHIKEEPNEETVDDGVPLFIPPDSPTQDHIGSTDLDSLPHSDWIKLEPTEASLPPESNDREALPADDGYETDKDDPVEDGGWIDLFEAQGKPGSSQSTLKSDEQSSWMGEDDKAHNYDENAIFKHLVFYLDSPDSARANNMKVWTGHQEAIAISFDETREKILANGGQITNDLNDPKLTHVVLDDRDRSRRVPLMRATELPKRKRLVLREFIDICIEDGTLRDEADWEP